VTNTTLEQRATPLPVGTQAPEFTLASTPNQKISLTDFRGQPTILVFYPEDWSPVCSDQLALYQELIPEFQKFNAQLLAISVDGVWSHLAFANDRNLRFPLLADFEPKGKVARTYGVYRQQDGTSERALYVIDGDGVVRWSYVSPVGINPGADGILRALEDLGTKVSS
jgi:peroxiredoxin